MLPVRFAQIGLKPLLLEVAAGERDCRRREVDTRNDRSPFRKTRQVGAGTAPDLQHAAPGIAIEIDQLQQMVQLLEMILIEIGEKAGRADRMRGDLEIVYVP